MELFKLIGVFIIIIGFIIKFDTIAIVLIAGVITGLVSGLSLVEILEILGSTFVNTRYMTLFLLTLPVIGLLERYGLKEQAANLIKKTKKMTAGKIISMYTVIRIIATAFSLRMSGHVQFIRPLIHPIAYAATKNKYKKMDDKSDELIKGYAAASDNYGNFFGQNVFVASGGVLLIIGTLEAHGINVIPLDIAKASIPIAVITIIYSLLQNIFLDMRIKKKLEKNSPGNDNIIKEELS